MRGLRYPSPAPGLRRGLWPLSMNGPEYNAKRLALYSGPFILKGQLWQLCFCCLVDQLPEAGGADQRHVLREAEGGSDHFTTGVIDGEVHDGQTPLGKGEIVETDCAFDLVFAGGTIGRDGS